MSDITPLIDNFERRITYLRLSLTDRCDFRCTYCMPQKTKFMSRHDILSLEECLLVARVFVDFGVNKIRLTGGEPLVRNNMLWLVERLRWLDGLRELVLTTNGSQLWHMASSLAKAGIDRVNISLDSLREDIFRNITRTGDLRQVLAGIDAAIDAFGCRNVKLNSVILRDVNLGETQELVEFALSRQIDISFIEQMPLGLSGSQVAQSFCSSKELQSDIEQKFELIPSLESSGGPARYWRIPGRQSRIGFISPHSQNFCAGCNRMRVSARGGLFPCLGNENEVNLLPAARAGNIAGLRELIMQTVERKPHAHVFDLTSEQTKIIRFMSHTGG